MPHEQLTFGPAPTVSKPERVAPYQRTSDTSRAAAKSLDANPSAKAAFQQAVQTVYISAGPRGLTMKEAAIELTRRLGRPIEQSSVNGRVAHGGDMSHQIVPTGAQRRNPYSTRPAEVYVYGHYLNKMRDQSGSGYVDVTPAAYRAWLEATD